MRKACELIEQHQSITYTMDNIPYRHDDERLTDEQLQMLDEAFMMMGRGETIGVFQVESSGNAFAVSHVGAIGLMQLRPTTAEEVAGWLGIRWTGASLLFDPVANVRLGVKYLSSLVERYDDIPTALAAYNWGPTRIAQKIRRGDAIPAAYSDRVLAKYGATTAI